MALGYQQTAKKDKNPFQSKPSTKMKNHRFGCLPVHYRRLA